LWGSPRAQHRKVGGFVVEHVPPPFLAELVASRRVFEGRVLFGEVVLVVVPKDREDDRGR